MYNFEPLHSKLRFSKGLNLHIINDQNDRVGKGHLGHETHLPYLVQPWKFNRGIIQSFFKFWALCLQKLK